MPKMAAEFADRIFFAHLRQLKFINKTDFYENGHQTAAGDADIYVIVKELVGGSFMTNGKPEEIEEKTRRIVMLANRV